MVIKCKENIENYMEEVKYTLKSFDSDINKISKITDSVLPGFNLDQTKNTIRDEVLEDDNINSMENDSNNTEQ